MVDKQQSLYFKKNFGSDPEDVSEIFNELFLFVDPSEMGASGFKQFMVALYFLWNYPKNSFVLSTVFQHYCERYCRGEHIWKWVARIAALKESKILLEKAFEGHELEFALSGDGVEFGAWEHQHPRYNMDTKSGSRKNGRCGYKYMFYLALWAEKLVMVDGPHKGGVSEIQIVRDGIKPLLRPNTRMVVDGGMKNDADAEEKQSTSLQSRLSVLLFRQTSTMEESCSIRKRLIMVVLTVLCWPSNKHTDITY